MAEREQLIQENEALREQIGSLEQQLESLQQLIEGQYKSVIEEKDSLIKLLTMQLDYLKQKLFGTGRSEKLDVNQQVLDLDLKEEEPEPELIVTKVPEHERKKRGPRPSREESYENLPVEETIEIIPDEVKENPDGFERTEAAEETFEVDYQPPKFFRRRIIRPKYRRKDKPEAPLVVAPAEPRVVEGLVAVGLLVLIIISKFIDHLPLYRQAKMYARLGCILSQKSMMRWVEKVAQWIQPIYDIMAWELRQGNYLQADETPIQFCDPDLGLKKTRKGYFCAYSRPNDNVIFVWREGRTYEDVAGFLNGYAGLLQADAYAPYLSFAKANDAVTLLGCMAHARRKFMEAQKYQPRESLIVLRLMARLYVVEKKIREADPEMSAEEIVALRKKKSVPTLARIHRVLRIIQQRYKLQDPVFKAAGYSLSNWPHLCEYVKHAEAQIDNNLIENAIRPTAVGKKNWLFIGHPKAGDRAAIIYSLLISCERLGVNPHDYLSHVLRQDTRTMTREQLRELTPKAFAER